ncbi:MAG TPA: hypothetical protein VNV85_07250, partial [Puia sp.]|nr:hypothetical protein [Puia sp.]
LRIMNKLLAFFNKIMGLVIFLIFLVVLMEHIHHGHFWHRGHQRPMGGRQAYGDSIKTNPDTSRKN